MWTLRRLQNELSAMACALVGVVIATPADAQFINNNGNVPSYYSSQNYNYGLNLPQVPLPTGQDEIRAADGTACRSNTASNNAYLDMGAIGSQGYGGEFDQGTFYGRVIVPLGDVPKRLDCSSLYNLEIQRLQHELALVRAGAGNLDVVSAAPDAPTIPMKIAGPQSAGPQAAPIAQKPVAQHGAQNGGPSGRAKTAGREKAWAKEGWSNSGWQGASKVGAAAQAGPTPGEPVANTAPPQSTEPQSVGPQSSVAPLAAPAAVAAHSMSNAIITTASITAPATATGTSPVTGPETVPVTGIAAVPIATPTAAQVMAPVTASITAPVTESMDALQPVEIELLPWLSYPAVGPRYVTLMTGHGSDESSQPPAADRARRLPPRDVSVADMTRNAMGSPY